MTKATVKEKEPGLFGNEAKADPAPRTPARKKNAVAKVEPTAAKPKSTAVAIRRDEPLKPMEATSANLMAMVAAIARDPNSNPEKMRAVLDMVKEIKAEEARMAFTRDFIALQEKLPSISRDGKIVVKAKDARTGERTGAVQQNTPFATYPNIHRVVKPLLREHGFSYSSSAEPAPDGQRLNIVGLLEHTTGHFRKSTFPLPAETSGSKNNVQGWGSAASFGKRYNIILLLDIVSHDPIDSDRDGFAPDRGEETTNDARPQEKQERLSPDDVKNMKDKIKACGVGEKKFCEHYGIERVEDLPPERYDEASSACITYGRNNKKAG